MYDTRTRRKLATSYMRDKRGARSTAYHLSLVSDVLLSYLSRPQLNGRLAAWEAVMKTIILVGNDPYAESIFPNVLTDLIDEYQSCSDDSNRTRNAKAKLLTFISYAILLRPDFESAWPAILRLLRDAVEQEDLASVKRLIYPTLLNFLSMVFRRKGDLAILAGQMLPLLCRVLPSAEHSESVVLCFRLMAACQSYCHEHLPEILDASDSALQHAAPDQTQMICREILRLLAYLAGFVPLYDSSLAIGRLLESDPMIISVEADKAVAEQQIQAVSLAGVKTVAQNGSLLSRQIRASMSFCPVLPVRAAVTDYPDLRRYQDAQFGTLSLSTARAREVPDALKIWETSDVRDEQEWNQWLYSLADGILQSCPVDLLKVVSPVRSPLQILAKTLPDGLSCRSSILA